MSSYSSTGSLLTPATAIDLFAGAEPVVRAERSSEGECERNVVAKASRASATTTNPKFNRRFMETSVWAEMQSGLAPSDYGQRLEADVSCLTYHDLVFSGVNRVRREPAFAMY
jgi:hypothetical protein